LKKRECFVLPELGGAESNHGRVRTIADLSAAEIAAIEADYGMPVRARTSAEIAQKLAEKGCHTPEPDGSSVDPHKNAVPVVQTKKKKTA
jgi:hypothetical protein